MRYETPRELLTRLKTGREESMQRLLTSLILAAPYPRWNTRNTPSAAGVEWLGALYGLAFGEHLMADALTFVDEFELRGRTDDERGGSPDYAVLWPGRVWIIELKTESGSHRADQLPMYLDLAHHYFPDALIDMTYLTPPLNKPAPHCAPWSRFAHVTWQQVQPLVRAAWPEPSDPGQREVVEGLCEAIDLLDLTPTEWRAHVLGRTDEPMEAVDPIAVGIGCVAETAGDRTQRGVELVIESLDDLFELSANLRRLISELPVDSPLRHVRPWVWRAGASGGAPLTALGAEKGFELRVSWYERPM